MAANNYGDLLLGKETEYCSEYTPELLCPIPRGAGRDALAITEPLPFYGVDQWTAYELSWLDSLGKPMVAIAEFAYSCDSQAIIESKSFKLYLNSLNQTRFDNRKQLAEVLTKDLSAATGANVAVRLWLPDEWTLLAVKPIPGQCLDEQEVAIECYEVDDQLLQCSAGTMVEQTVHSHLLRSLCPVTGQPDWGSVVITYKGARICPEGLLKYIVSYREHQDFHEQCVERIFCDIMARCQPEALTVYARYVRRGGLDINPYRSTETNSWQFDRLARQ